MNKITTKELFWVVVALVVALIPTVIKPYFERVAVIQAYAVTNAYRFPYDASQVDLTLKPGDTQWVIVPAGLHVREDATDGNVRICLLDLKCFNDGPNIVNTPPVELSGARQGTFGITNLDSKLTTVTLVQL